MPGLGDGDDVEDEQQRNGECGDEAERQRGHRKDNGCTRSSRDLGRAKERSKPTEGDGGDEVGDSEEMPEDEDATVAGGGECVRNERRGDSDGDVAPSSGQGKEPREDAVGGEDEKDESGDAPGVKDRDDARREREDVAPEFVRTEIPPGEEGDGEEYGDEDREWRRPGGVTKR